MHWIPFVKDIGLDQGSKASQLHSTYSVAEPADYYSGFAMCVHRISRRQAHTGKNSNSCLGQSQLGNAGVAASKRAEKMVGWFPTHKQLEEKEMEDLN
ncbi:hypothetical protein Q3G72_011397 [Acer saccharum]|nr:hypothetical protein Q3G72_011397 [Acer saccharum]